METSAKTGENVEVFIETAKKILYNIKNGIKVYPTNAVSSGVQLGKSAMKPKSNLSKKAKPAAVAWGCSKR